jgi:hypothetical protein
VFQFVAPYVVIVPATKAQFKDGCDNEPVNNNLLILANGAKLN